MVRPAINVGMRTDGRRAIQCTPPDDGAFLRVVSGAYGQALHGLTGEMPLLVGTLVLIRRLYPAAVITLLSLPALEDRTDVVWLVARDGWATAPHAGMSRPENGSVHTVSSLAAQSPRRHRAIGERTATHPRHLPAGQPDESHGTPQATRSSSGPSAHEGHAARASGLRIRSAQSLIAVAMFTTCSRSPGSVTLPASSTLPVAAPTPNAGQNPQRSDVSS
jgi:hypothetical protein